MKTAELDEYKIFWVVVALILIVVSAYSIGQGLQQRHDQQFCQANATPGTQCP